MPGFPELLFILIILAIIFGARALPELGAAIGRFLSRDKAAADSRDPDAPGDKSS